MAGSYVLAGGIENVHSMAPEAERWMSFCHRERG